jgi:hypothetical protein
VQIHTITLQVRVLNIFLWGLDKALKNFLDTGKSTQIEMEISGASQTVLGHVRKVKGLTANTHNSFEWRSQLSKSEKAPY